MSQARASFVTGLNALRASLSEPWIQDLTPADVGHNERARLIRNGLAIMQFSLLEEFIRARTAELLGKLDTSRIAFASLPEKLQLAATRGAIRALDYQSRYKGASDAIAMIGSHAQGIASVLGPSTYKLSEMCFGRSKANLTEDDIRDVLSAVHVEKPWLALDQLSPRLNMGGAMVLRTNSWFLLMQGTRRPILQQIKSHRVRLLPMPI